VAKDGGDRGGAATGEGMEVTAADGASGDSDEEFARADGRQGELSEAKREAGAVEEGGGVAHRS